MESELDVENVEKILEAAQQIEKMAKTRPEQAAEMLQRARYLVDLAEQIKRDWLNRFASVPPGMVAQALSRVIPARAEPATADGANAELQGVY
jgi:hypothetical protein